MDFGIVHCNDDEAEIRMFLPHNPMLERKKFHCKATSVRLVDSMSEDSEGDFRDKHHKLLERDRYKIEFVDKSDLIMVGE